MKKFTDAISSFVKKPAQSPSPETISPETIVTVTVEPENLEDFKALLGITDGFKIKDAVQKYRLNHGFVDFGENHRLIGEEIKNAFNRKGEQVNYPVMKELVNSFLQEIKELKPDETDSEFEQKIEKYNLLKELYAGYFERLVELEVQFPPIDSLSSAILGGATKLEIKSFLKFGTNLEQKHLDLINGRVGYGEVKDFINIFLSTDYQKLKSDLQTKLSEGLAAKEGVDDLLYNKGFVQSIDGDFVGQIFATNCHPELIKLVLESGVKLVFEDVIAIDKFADEYNKYHGSLAMESLMVQYLKGLCKNISGAQRSGLVGLLHNLESKIIDGINKEREGALKSLENVIENWKGQGYSEHPDEQKVHIFEQILGLSFLNKKLIKPSDLSRFVSKVILNGSDTDIRVLRRSGFFDMIGSESKAKNELVKNIQTAMGQNEVDNEDSRNKNAQLSAIIFAISGAEVSPEFQNSLVAHEDRKHNVTKDRITKKCNTILEKFKDGNSVDVLRGALEASYVSGDVKKYYVERDHPKIVAILESAIEKSDVETANMLIELDCVGDKDSMKKDNDSWYRCAMRFIYQAHIKASHELKSNGKNSQASLEILDKLTDTLRSIIITSDSYIFENNTSQDDMVKELRIADDILIEYNGKNQDGNLLKPKTKPVSPTAQRGGAAAELSDEEEGPIRGSIR